MKRALIIGHTGQDGQILWNQLVRSGYALVGVSRTSARSHEATWTIPVDVTKHSAITDLINYFKPDRIFFLAAHHHSSQDITGDDSDLWAKSQAVHVEAFRNVLQCVNAARLDSRIFLASSSRVFGAADSARQNERTAHRPICIYGVTKSMAMAIADYYRRVHGMFVSAGILFNHESPLRAPKFVSRLIIDGLVDIKFGGSNTLELGSLDARVDWGYAPDFTRAMQMILDAEEPNDFVIATGESHSVRDLVSVAADYMNIPWEKYVVEAPKMLHRKPLELCGNASLLKRVTSWAPSIRFEVMVRILASAAIARRTGGEPTFPW